MKRFLISLLWVAVGISTIALTSAGPATAGISQGSGTHPFQVHVINLHKAYEAWLGHAKLGKIAGEILPVGAKPPRGQVANGQAANDCVEPNCPVVYNGGSVQHSPHVYLLLWGPNWFTDPSQEATATYLENFYRGLGVRSDDNWSTVMSQYGDTTGSPTFTGPVLAGIWQDMNPPPTGGQLGQVGLAAEADAFTTRMGVTDVKDAQVVVATQSGTCPDGFDAPACTGGNGGGYCAWHSYSNEPFTNLPYIPDAGGACGQDSVNPNGTNDGLTIAAGHEYAETITDPKPTTGWWDPDDPGGGEIADKCPSFSTFSRDVKLSTGTYAMQPLWSNKVGGCVMHIGGASDAVSVTNPGNQSTYQNSVLNLTVSGVSTKKHPLTWSATGLPAGLTINSATGIISGKITAPVRPQPYPVIVTATDTTGAFGWAPFNWTVLADVGTPITNQASGTCLNDQGQSIIPGNQVIMFRCLNGPAEMFTQPTNAGELIVLGQCLTDPTGGAGGGGAGTLQVVEPCTSSANQNQVWLHNSKNEYVLELNFMCLTDLNGSTLNGAKVAVEPCTGATDQIWSGS
jgi:Putative Ig domain/Ricin-type beta-trefoil lectin domain